MSEASDPFVACPWCDESLAVDLESHAFSTHAGPFRVIITARLTAEADAHVDMHRRAGR